MMTAVDLQRNISPSVMVLVFMFVSCFRLAALTAAVMLSRDVPVHLFSSFVPTPYVVSESAASLPAGQLVDSSSSDTLNGKYKA